MAKKGLIVTIFTVIIALVILIISNFIANVRENKELEEHNEPTQKEVIETPVPTTVAEAKDVEVTSSPQVNSGSETTTNKNTSDNANTYSVFNESDLATLEEKSSDTEVMVVASKHIVLLSDNKNDSKQLMYAIDMFTSRGNSLSYYVSQSVYDSVNVGSKLNVEYTIYTNTNNIELPIINKVTQINQE